MNPSSVRRASRHRSVIANRPVAWGLLVLSLAILPGLANAQKPAAHVMSTKHYRKDYRFTSDWFTPAIPVWKKVLSDYQGKPDIHYLEVGVFQGRSALWMLENILTHPSARMTTIDILENPTYLENLEKSGAADKATTLIGPSQEVLLTLPADSFDIIYIDGSHQGDHVLTDAVLAWGLLKEGGTLIFDDYAWNKEWADEVTPGVAVDTFVTLFRRELDVTWRKHQLVVKRRKPVCSLATDLYCSRLGNYAYYWRKKALLDSQSGKEVTLTDSERAMVEKLIRSVRIGESTVSIPSDLENDPTLIRLREKLDL
jgi:hypothetical protein